MPNDFSTPIALGRFGATQEELLGALSGPVIARLTELGVIAVEGTDAVSFLQSQLTNDVAALRESDFQLNGYCTPKGRLLATFQQWKVGSTILLQLPRELLPAVRKRLSMFVLRSKVTLGDASDAWSTFVIVGKGAAERLRDAGVEVPTTPWSSATSGAMRVHRLPGAAPLDERFMLTMARDSSLSSALSALPAVASGVWWWSEVNAAIPTVFAATQEKFVPQMINLEVLGGVNFKKGCYPGQEIVARSQYLGKLKRRMHRAHVDDGNPLAAGADIFLDGVATGTVVMSADAPGGGYDLLFEAPSDRIDQALLRAGSAEGPALTLTALPYALFDPTA